MGRQANTNNTSTRSRLPSLAAWTNVGASFLGHGSSDDGPIDRAATLHHCPSDMETITPLRLYIKLKDGSVLSGVYPWPQAVAQLSFAAKLPQFDDYTLENA